MTKLKIIFIGTDWIGTELLEALCKQSEFFEVQLVITGQDKPAGRKLILQPSPIKLMAEKMGVEVFQPLNINAEMSVSKLKNLNPDFLLVMAYGQLLKQEVLDLPKIACLNVHPSLLPKYRGASPVQGPILHGDKKTGVSLMKMVLKMDAGPFYEQTELAVDPKDTGQTLAEKLSQLTAEVVPKALLEIAEGKLKPQEQDEKKVTHCGKFSKADGQIDWNHSADQIEARIRAFDPWPGTFTFFEGKRLKILSAEIQHSEKFNQAGLVTEQGIVCGKGILKPLKVQLEGGNPQSLEDFMNGHPEFLGAKLG